MGPNPVTGDLDPMSELHDPELGAALRALVPENTTTDVAETYQRSLPRFVHARRRRRATIAAGAVAACLVVGVGVGLTRTSSVFSGVRTTEPAGRGPSPSNGNRDGTTTSTRPDSTAPDGSVPSAPTSTTTPETEVPNPTGSKIPGPSGGSLPTSATTIPVGPRVYSSTGGSIRVQLGNGSVTLLGTTPAAGYAPDIRSSGPAEVEVRFRLGTSGKTETMIRIRFDSDGQLQVEIT